MPMPKGWRKYDGYDWREFGAWIAKLRSELGWTLEKLAAEVKLNNKGTMKGIEQGRRGLSDVKRHELVLLLANATSNDAPRRGRRDFLKATGLAVAGLITIESITAVETSDQVHLIRGKDKQADNELEMLVHDLGTNCIAGWDYQLYTGKAAFVLEQATKQFELLKKTRYADDYKVALTAIRVGMRLARSQETVLNWYSRCSKAIATYDKVEEIIRRSLLRYNDKTSRSELQHEYGRLLALRAPLFREMHEYPKSVEDAANGIEIAGKLGDSVLLSDLLRNRAHIAAVGGQGKLWEHKLNEAEATIQQVSGNLQSQLLYMQMYYRGEGNKRLAFNTHNQLSENHRTAYAQKAIDSFRDAREGLENQWSDIVLAATVSGHPLLTRVSEAQCFVWVDPEYAETLLWQLRSECEINFPALLDKIDLATVYAGLRLKQKKYEPPPTFDLDARYRRVSH